MRKNVFSIILILLSIGLLALLFSTRNKEVPNENVSAPDTMNQATNSSTTAENILDFFNNDTGNLQAINTPKPLDDLINILAKTSNTTQTNAYNSGMRTNTTKELMAWIYPYTPACSAVREFSDGRKIDILKPEFFTINGGSLILLDESTVDCNGYSSMYVAKVKLHSTKQFVTVSSASAEDMSTFLRTALSSDTAIQTLVTFVATNKLTGIELNFEDFGNWTDTNYTDFKTFVTRLGANLHAKDKQLMVVGPAVSNTTEEKWFVWRYEDFTALPVDRMVVMGYDYQYDYGAGEPIAPLVWLRNVVSWVSARYPMNKLTIALPSYGYEGRSGTHEVSILTYEQIKSRPGFSTAVRNTSSGEMTWETGGYVYFYQDSISLAKKRDLLLSLGIQSFSIWHLGGNPWF